MFNSFFIILKSKKNIIKLFFLNWSYFLLSFIGWFLECSCFTVCNYIEKDHSIFNGCRRSTKVSLLLNFLLFLLFCCCCCYCCCCCCCLWCQTRTLTFFFLLFFLRFLVFQLNFLWPLKLSKVIYLSILTVI